MIAAIPYARSASDAAAASEGLGALGLTGLQVGRDALELLLGNERAHVGIGIDSGAEFYLAGLVGDALDDAIVNLFLHVEPGTGAAALAVIEEDRVGRALDGGIHILHVLEDDGG